MLRTSESENETNASGAYFTTSWRACVFFYKTPFVQPDVDRQAGVVNIQEVIGSRKVNKHVLSPEICFQQRRE